MISDEQYKRYESEVEELAGIDPRLDPPPGDPGRVDRIVDKARYEAVVNDTTRFVIQSFGSALSGLTGAMLGSAGSGGEAGETGEDAETSEHSRQDKQSNES